MADRTYCRKQNQFLSHNTNKSYHTYNISRSYLLLNEARYERLSLLSPLQLVSSVSLYAYKILTEITLTAIYSQRLIAPE